MREVAAFKNNCELLPTSSVPPLYIAIWLATLRVLLAFIFTVPLNEDTIFSWRAFAPLLIVQVTELPPSNLTMSSLVGAENPPFPPDVFDQLAVSS